MLQRNIVFFILGLVKESLSFFTIEFSREFFQFRFRLVEPRKTSYAFNDDETTMDEILRIFKTYDSRKRPHIGKTLNVTGSVSYQIN